MLTRDVVDKLNELLSRELTALEWHDRALEEVVHVELAHLLVEFREQHDQRITVLRNTICELIEEEVLCAIGRARRNARSPAAGQPESERPAALSTRAPAAVARDGEGARRRPANASRRAITRQPPVIEGARRA